MSSIIDVSKRANVSIATVSRYLRGTAKVSNLATKRIEEAITELNYLPDFFAASLKSQYSNIVGLLAPGIDNQFFNSMIGKLETSLNQNKCNLLVAFTQSDIEIQQKYIRTFLSMRVNAILYTPDIPNKFSYASIRNSDTYALQLYLDKDETIDSVVIDDAYGTELAIDYFFEHHYFDVIMIDLEDENFQLRKNGFMNAYKKRGLDISENNFIIINLDNAEEIITKILMEKKHPALLVIANIIGNIIIRLIIKLNLKLKEDVSLIIYDDIELADIFNITCIGHNKEEIAGGITEVLMENIGKSKNKEIVKKMFKPHLIIRDSV